MRKSQFDPSQPYTYVRYGRMSSNKQNPRSPDQQFDTIEAVRQRLEYPWTQRHDYRDDGISGRYMRKRPGFWKMLADIRTGRIKVDLVLVDTLERFGRMRALPTLREQLENKYGVLILTADSNFADPTSTAGQALGFVESMRATGEAHAKAHNVRRGRLDAAKLKRWPGGPVPMGYRLENVVAPGCDPAVAAYHRLAIDPVTAPAVQLYFDLAAKRGWGANRIAKHCNADLDFVAKYGPVNASQVSHILGSPIYKGVLCFNKHTTDVVDDRRVIYRNDDCDVVYIADFCAPLVSPEVFDRLNEQRRERGARIRGYRAKTDAPDGKRLQPLAPGLVLKYPLIRIPLSFCAQFGAS